MPSEKNRLPRRYTYLAIVFTLVGIGVLALVGVSLYGQAEIIVMAAQDRTSGEFVLTVQDLPFDAAVSDPTVVPGKIFEVVVEQGQTSPATGQKVQTGENSGVVTLVNTTPRSQTLVATTRLLASDATLVRLKDRVVVPANGKITAVAYPDQPATFRELKPTRLTIPGLAVILQDKIYAETTEPWRAGGASVAVVKPEDLVNVQAQLVEKLSQEALSKFEATLSESERTYTKLVQKEVLEKTFDAQAGDQRNEFLAKVKMKVVYVAFDETRLIAVIRQHLSKQLPFTHLLQAVDAKTLRYEAERYDATRKEVSLKVYAEGKSALRTSSALLNPARLTGLTKAQIISLLSGYPEVKSVTVRFTPEGMRRSPRLPNRIHIIIQ